MSEETTRALIAQAGSWFDSHQEQYVGSVFRLVRIASVGSGFDPASDHPFGEECARVVDEACALGRELGLETRNFSYYAAGVGLPGRKDAYAQAGRQAGRTDGRYDSLAAADIAFFSHIDVVGPGEGWDFNPFDPFKRNGWLYGRGVDDNKGPAAAVLFALCYLKDAGYVPRHNLALYLGANEEVAMEDVRYLITQIAPPQVSLVSDAYFSVCVGEKGIVEFELTRTLRDPALTSLAAGDAKNAVAGTAKAVTTHNTYLASGRAAHAARPEGSLNAIGLLAENLACAEELAASTRSAFSFVAEAARTYDGSAFGIAATDQAMGPLTCVAATASLEPAGTLRVRFNLRHPASIDQGEIIRSIGAKARKHGFDMRLIMASPAFRTDPDRAVVSMLNALVNEHLGTELAPYCMAGGTHARLIPNAVGFGPGRSDQKSPFPAGTGGAHQPNEAVCLKHLRDAFVIYVHALVELDQNLERYL